VQGKAKKFKGALTEMARIARILVILSLELKLL